MHLQSGCIARKQVGAKIIKCMCEAYRAAAVPQKEERVMPTGIAGIVLAAREAKKMNREDLAARLGINKATLGNIETGNSKPSVNLAELLEKELGCELPRKGLRRFGDYNNARAAIAAGARRKGRLRREIRTKETEAPASGIGRSMEHRRALLATRVLSAMKATPQQLDAIETLMRALGL